MSEDFSVIIPAHNEGENIAALLAETLAASRGLPLREILVVDDASTDSTASVLAGCVAPVRVLRHPVRAGQSEALMTGVRAATSAWVITMDGDGQNDPADIANLYAALVNARAPETLGMIAGQRRQRKDSRAKRISSRLAGHIRGALLHDGIKDTGCGLKMIRRDVYLRLPYFNHMHRYLPALVQREGYRVATMDVGHRPRAAGRSHYGTLDRLAAGIIDLLGVLWLQRRAPKNAKGRTS